MVLVLEELLANASDETKNDSLKGSIPIKSEIDFQVLLMTCRASINAAVLKI